MIQNERQYRITKSQAEQFRKALEELKNARISDPKSPEYLPWKIQFDAVASQLGDLEEDIREYESLRTEGRTPIEISSIEEFPRTLIQGRIAARLTQKELAGKLGLKEQQIQRYESTEYQGASLDRIKQVVKALGINVQQQVFLPDQPISVEVLLKKLEGLGLEKDFVLRRMVPERLRTAMERGESAPDMENIAVQWASSMARVFRVNVRDLFRAGPVEINESAVVAGRFKLPANFAKTKFAAYTVYAHYLALLMLQATPDLMTSPIPASWKHVRRQILARYSELNLNSVVSYCWDMGIPVLPLRDPGIFHGATWRVQGRNVIVVKQQTKSEARWMTDILHEVRHAAENPDLSENSAIEFDPRSDAYTKSVDEEIATDFAADVLLNGKAEELAEECATACSRRMEWLKTSVHKVATRNGVREDVLANYLAYRLANEGQDWWATAMAMQRTNDDVWKLVREPALLRLDWSRLAPPDRELLQMSLHSKE
jgi:transcriptional regulator with XRE-family HTH domain